jgi:hypothetical protein
MRRTREPNVSHPVRIVSWKYRLEGALDRSKEGLKLPPRFSNTVSGSSGEPEDRRFVKHVLTLAMAATATLALASSSNTTGRVAKLQLEDGRATLVIVNDQRIQVTARTEDAEELRLGILARLEMQRVGDGWQAVDVDVDADFDGVIEDDEALPDDEEEGDGLGD